MNTASLTEVQYSKVQPLYYFTVIVLRVYFDISGLKLPKIGTIFAY